MIESHQALQVGASLPNSEYHPGREHLVRFTAAAEDYSYQHWDLEKMRANGFPDVIVHGWLIVSYMLRGAALWIPPEVARISEYSVRYHRPAYPGKIICGGQVESVDRAGRSALLSLHASDGHGELLTRCSASLSFSR